MARILVVDDEEDVQAALQRRLEREGHHVTPASSASDASTLLHSPQDSYDLVLSDMSMEEGDSGLKVLQDALSQDLFTEVIVLTAYGNVANAVESMRRGAFDYLEKNVPGVDVYELLTIKVQHALERRQSAVSTVRRLEQFAAMRR